MAEAADAAGAIVEIVATAGIAATAGNASEEYLPYAGRGRARPLPDCLSAAIAIGLPHRIGSRHDCHQRVNGRQLSAQ